MAEEPDEFEQIARLYRPLTNGSPDAFGLLDDAAVIPSRPGFDLVVTKDATVEGVHFLPGESLDLVARKLLRVNLSDLAAKAAEPDGYLLAVAWPAGTPLETKARFAAGLAEDQPRFGVRLLGGDTVSTSGPLVASLTLFGWTPAGRMVRRGGGRSGDVLLVSGTIGDAGLGLRAAKGEALGLSAAAAEASLVLRHRLPTPRLVLRETLRRYASAAADVSDGLFADAGHIGQASGSGVRLQLETMPISTPAATWLASQPDRRTALVDLATAGDDYEIVCATSPRDADEMIASAARAGVALSRIGDLTAGQGLGVTLDGQLVDVGRRGWMHT